MEDLEEPSGSSTGHERTAGLYRQAPRTLQPAYLPKVSSGCGFVLCRQSLCPSVFILFAASHSQGEQILQGAVEGGLEL